MIIVIARGSPPFQSPVGQWFTGHVTAPLGGLQGLPPPVPPVMIRAARQDGMTATLPLLMFTQSTAMPGVVALCELLHVPSGLLTSGAQYGVLLQSGDPTGG